MALNILAGRIPDCIVALNKIVDASDDLQNKIPFEASYWSMRMINKLKDEELSYLKSKDGLLQKYAERVMDSVGKPTNQFKFTEIEKSEKFNAELKELFETDIVIEGISTKPLSVFGKEYKKINSAVKTLLGVLITDDIVE